MFANLNYGDLIFQLFSLLFFLLPIILVVCLIIYIVRIVRRTERRADERLNLDKEYSALQQQQMQAITELNHRLTRIEDMLKEVD